MRHKLNVTTTNITQVTTPEGKVWREQFLDTLRASHCLCLRCGAFSRCKTVKKLARICKADNIALAVTRCPNWEPHGKPK